MDARLIRVRGIVQGVGFRPFVHRLALSNGLHGWVLNQADGVEIHVEGSGLALEAFTRALTEHAPPAAEISGLEICETGIAGVNNFVIRKSERLAVPSVRISPDLPVCEACLAELFDSADPRYLYPYINCTNCGPRFTIVESLPYDRSRTSMRDWPMCTLCAAQYNDPLDRRFHAQPVACPVCGPHYSFESAEGVIRGADESVQAAAYALLAGRILAVKGIGGYHLSCDARNTAAVRLLRERKFRKEKPFAVMACDVATARGIVELSGAAEGILCSSARPIVLAPARVELEGVAPDNRELGLMLPYAPLHYLLFAAGAPKLLVMTSANRSSEPIAYRDEDARETLSGLADAFLIGERPIARRVDDSVARAGVSGPIILRRSRGYAPAAVTTIPTGRPILALGGDLKNTITLVVAGQAFVSQHIGDLEHYEALAAFKETIRDFISMYGLNEHELTVVHDLHPQYASTQYALEIAAQRHCAIQHHRAHVASVIAERRAWDKRVVAVSFDGTGFGDDGTIWGGEFFVGSVAEGWTRALHLRPALLPGGDAAARFPVQCAAGFLNQLEDCPNLIEGPFHFSRRYLAAQQMVERQVRVFPTSSMGRLFDTVAALLGFTREITFEGQAAMWLEQLARTATASSRYSFPVVNDTLDFRPLLAEIIRDRTTHRDRGEIARAFHVAVANGIHTAVTELHESDGTHLVVLSGGVFQNELLLEEIKARMRDGAFEVWTNRAVPPNDGGISLGQAACAAFAPEDISSLHKKAVPSAPTCDRF
jgi:hydrogenase maturation protein HypF